MPHLSREQAYLVFALVLVAYTVQCELASYLNRVGYTKPFFLLYLTHSSYSAIGVFHYFAYKYHLRRRGEDTSIRPYLQEVQDAIKAQLLGPTAGSKLDTPFPWEKAAKRLLALTVLIALPAGIWYASISLTSMTSLTALYNLNAFWAYILSIYYSRSEKWGLRSGLAVSVACVGVLVMTYGDSKEGQESIPGTVDGTDASELPQAKNFHLLGDLLGLLSSFACGFYEVWYKRYIALPASSSIPLEDSDSTYSRIYAPSGDDTSPKVDSEAPKNIDAELEDIEASLYSSRSPTVASGHKHNELTPLAETEQNPALFLLHANTITACIGLTTMALFWIPIPFLHLMGWEKFSLPPDGTSYLAIMGVCLGGVIFNAGFMILLSLWGPVVTSVGNLFTLILVAISDEVIALLNGYSSLSFSTLAGSGFILAAFGMLVTGPSPKH